jgi:hypothetical protein
MKKFVKQQAKPRKTREPRTVIVSFRLRKSEAQALKDEMSNQPMAGVKSLKQYARKLTLDHAAGRTVYIHPRDMDVDPGPRNLLPHTHENIDMRDPKFVKALSDFLSSEENWNRLRFFMLHFGWPMKFAKQFQKAMSGSERMRVARTLLKTMTNESTQTDQRQ